MAYPGKIVVSDVKPLLLGQVNSFIVDASNSPAGAMEITVSAGSDDAHVAHEYKKLTEKKFRIDFEPSECVDHRASITFNQKHIAGSPFVMQAPPPDVSLITVSGDGHRSALINQQASFTVDASGTSRTAPLEVKIIGPGGASTDATVLEKSSKVFDINWTPAAAGDYALALAYGDQQLRGSPFKVSISDHSHVTVKQTVPASTEGNAQFVVDCSRAGPGSLEVMVTRDGVTVPSTVIEDGNLTYIVTFRPNMAAPHQVAVRFNDRHIPGSPLLVEVGGGADAVVMTDAQTSHVAGQEVVLHLNAEGSGEGSLRAEVTSSDHGPVLSTIKTLSPKLYALSFTPDREGDYTVQVQFNNAPVPGSPLSVSVEPHESTFLPQRTVSYLPRGHRTSPHEETFFDIDSHGAPLANMSVAILDPSGAPVTHRTTPQGEDRFRVRFTPTRAGTYSVSVSVHGSALPGSPYRYEVQPAATARVIDVMQTGNVGQDMHFIVDASSAAEGRVEASVSCEGRPVPVQMRAMGGGLHKCVYCPTHPGHHTINATYAGKPVPGTPVKAYVVDTGANLTVHSRGGRPSPVSESGFLTLSIKGAQWQADAVSAQVKAPNNELIASSLTPNGPDEIKVEYRSPHVGRHTVDIFYRGAKMGGSPYYVEVFDPQRVRFERVESQVYLNEPTELEVVADNAGTADIECRVMTPTGRPVPCDLVSNGNRLKGRYTPSEQGAHTVHVYIGGVEIPGSPRTQVVEVRQQPSPALPVSSRPVDLSRITVEGEGLYMGRKGKACPIIIKLHGASPGDKPAIRVEGPHSVANSTVEPVADGIYHASYVPAEVGTFSVALSWKGQPIPGSPFQPRVVDPGAMRIVNGLSSVLDQGRLPLTVGRETCIHVDATGCGAGALHAQVKDSAGNRIKVECKETTAGMYSVAFTPPAKREYTLTFFWGDLPVPGAPLSGYAKADVPLHPSKVLVSGTGLTLATVGKTAEFFMDGSKAGPGRPTVSLRAGRPGDPDIQVQCTQRSDGVYLCSYVPPVTGPYDLHLGWSNQRLPSSPYKLIVRGTPQPAMVRMEKGEWSAESPSGGPSAKGAKTMVMSHAINTKMAGPGELVARCRGPTKVAMCSLEAHGEGAFTLLVKPQEAGLHRLEVTYSGEHIPGSPQEFDFEAPFDPSKVIVKGAGVQHGILAAFQSRFTVDTKDAGEGSLTVKVRGPKGGFNVSMDRESERSIVCSYDPTEVGLYIISVQWSGESVPQSPFYVRIFDTYEELDRFIKTGRLPQEIARERSMQRSVKVAPRGRSLYSMTTPPPQVVPAGRPVVVGPPPQVLVNGPPPQVVMNGPPPQVVMNGPPPQLRHVQRVPTQHQRRAMSMKVNGYPYQGY